MELEVDLDPPTDMMKAATMLLAAALEGGRPIALARGFRLGRLGGGVLGNTAAHRHLPSPHITQHASSPVSSTALCSSLRDLVQGKNARAPIPLATVPTAPYSAGSVVSSPRISTATAVSPPPSVDVISISDAFDGGNGEFVSARIISEIDDDCDVAVDVKIRPDPYTDLEQKQHFQCFSFRSTLNRSSPAVKGIFGNQRSIKVKYAVTNAGEASYADAFNGYDVFVTTKPTPFDPDAWSRTTDSSYENGCLTWTHVHELGEDGSSSAYFAYFPPYSYERHLGLVARCAEAKGCKVKSLGKTVSGREIDCITVGAGARTCWIIHRQHPGESMAEFYAEGLLNRLLGLDGKWDTVAEKARELFTFHIVPNINPDGSSAGYLRTNAAGSNLNREWCPSPAPQSGDGEADKKDEMYEAPTLERSPEVYHVLRHMDQTGCDAFLDIHGDEALPFNFLAGSQGMGVWGKRLESLHGAFLASYGRANGDMQAKVSYEPDEPGSGMPNICSNQIAQRFDCFAGTLEMPFKRCWGDATNNADGNQVGWGPERARQLGASVLDALCYVGPYLRDETEFWDGQPDSDAYIHPTSKY